MDCCEQTSTRLYEGLYSILIGKVKTVRFEEMYRSCYCLVLDKNYHEINKLIKKIASHFTVIRFNILPSVLNDLLFTFNDKKEWIYCPHAVINYSDYVNFINDITIYYNKLNTLKFSEVLTSHILRNNSGNKKL